MFEKAPESKSIKGTDGAARVLNFRPLPVAALGFFTGILIGNEFKGTPLFFAVCLFCVLASAAAGYLGQKGSEGSIASANDLRVYALLLAAMLLGALRIYAYPDGDANGFVSLLLGDRAMETVMRLRSMLTERITGLYGDNGGYIAAIALGDTSGIDYSNLSAMRNAGIAHIFAVSGLHVGIMAGAVSAVIPKSFVKTRLAVTAVFLYCYCALCLFSASVVRAAVMFVTMLAAKLFSRRYDMPSSAALAAMLILAVSPNQAVKPGFLLSFSAVAGIMLLAGRIGYILRGLGSFLSSTLSVSIAATLGTAMPSIYFFGRFSMLGLAANIITVPLVPFVLIPGLISALICEILPFAAEFLAWASGGLLNVILEYVFALSDIKWCSIDVAMTSELVCFAWFVPMLIASPLCMLSASKRHRALIVSAAAVAVLLIFSL